MSQVLRKCNKCGFEAYTTKDLELFKTHSRYDPYLSSYPYGKDPICLKCYREYDNKAHREARKDPAKKAKANEAVMANYHKDPKKQRARDYSFRFLEADNTCAFCGATDVPLEKHHPDYKRPNFIVTLCRSCHHKLHVNLRISTQAKKPICDKCNFHPDVGGDFKCQYYGVNITQSQKRKNYCKGYTVKTDKPLIEAAGVYYCSRIKRNLTLDELLRLHCVQSQNRHWGTWTHPYGPCPKVSKVEQPFIPS